MIRALIPWNVLTRDGIPALKVARRPFAVGEVGEAELPVGALFDPELFPPQIRKTRLRQFYEQRRLEPVDAPKDSRQFYLERQARLRGETLPIAPVTPVASRIVADLPSVPVAASQGRPKPKGARR
jgi:hypothetical protein